MHTSVKHPIRDFDQIWNKNLFVTAKFALSELSKTLKQKKSAVNNITLTNQPQNQKHTDHFDVFPVPRDPFDITDR